MLTFSKYLSFLLVLFFTINGHAQQTEEGEEESGEKEQFVKVDSTSPDAIVHDGTDFFESNPVARLVSDQKVTLLGEEEDGYVKIKAKVDGKEIEGWIKKTALSDQRRQHEPTVSPSGGVDSAAYGSIGSVGMEPVDADGLQRDQQTDPWQHIDPTSADAKVLNSSTPYHLIIPAGILVAAGGVALALSNKSSAPDPDPPIEDPEAEDPPFVLLNDSYSTYCGQSILIYPLQNDVGTGLFITNIIDAPEGVQLINDTTIAIPSTLTGDVSFSIEIEDAVGQIGTNTVSITVEEFEIAANDDVFNLEAGETVSGNVVSNDLCLSCEVTNTEGTTGTLDMAASGEFEYTAPDDFSGEAVFVITIQNPCGAEATSSLIFIVALTGCDLALVNDTLFGNAGDVVDGNVFNNDLCQDCSVLDVTDAEGQLEWNVNGDFSYTAPENFEGTVVFLVTSVDACGQEGVQNLVIIVENPPCSFDWQGEVTTESSACGLETGSAFATEELFGPYNFAWSNGVEGVENSNLPSGTYQLYVTDTLTGCTDTLDASVDELPPDYALDFEILTGQCGETDNVQLFSNADIDQPLSITLSGSTEGIIENVTSPSIWLGDFVALNPGDLTITVWSEEAGPECAQSINLTLSQATAPELVVMDTGPELIVLEINNAVFPVEIFVNGELYVLANESPAFIEGLPPGEYEIFVVDATGCMSSVIVVMLEGGGMHNPYLTTRWITHSQGINNWIHNNEQLVLQTAEGQNGFIPVSAPINVPLFLEINKGMWVANGAAASSAYRNADTSGYFVRRVNYFEISVGRQFELFGSTVSVKIGNAIWSPQRDGDLNVRGWFMDTKSSWNVKSASGCILFGLRVGFVETSPQIMVMPNIQYTFSQ